MTVALSLTLRNSNKKDIAQSPKYMSIINQISGVENFLDDYGFLTLGRDYILCKNYSFSLQRIIMSAELTMGSIVDCCKSACIADANTLLRKYRDDLFFCLYIIVYDVNIKTGSVQNTKTMENNIEK